MISLVEWNKATMARLLWNLCANADEMWVKWMYIYFFKSTAVIDYVCASNSSWLLRAILNIGRLAHNSDLANSSKFGYICY